MKWLWNALDKKGRIATIIGLLFALPYNARFMWDFFHGVEYSRGQLEMVVIVNAIGWIWFILPSKITISGPKFNLTVED